MAEIGDTRDAMSLVTDMDRDHDALKISNLVMSQQGRDVLSRLAPVCHQVPSSPPCVSLLPYPCFEVTHAKARSESVLAS